MIKKWQDRVDIYEYIAGPIRNQVRHEFMQDEIDELRLALEKAEQEKRKAEQAEIAG
jgi:hypothetical protein